MKKLLIALISLAVFITLVWSAGEVVYKQGNVEAYEADFRIFYYDTIQNDAAEASARVIKVPNSKIGYNLKIWLADPDTREESLVTNIAVNSIRGIHTSIDSLQKYQIPLCNDFGYDNKADTFYFYGRFSEVSYRTSTNTAGANAADSIMHIHMSFSVMR